MDIQMITVLGAAVTSVSNSLLIAYVVTLVSRYMMKRLDVVGPVFLPIVEPVEPPRSTTPSVLSVTR
jgi:hypothetical protein